MFHVPVIIVDKVTETGCVNDGKAETDTILLNVWMMKREKGEKVLSVGTAAAYQAGIVYQHLYSGWRQSGAVQRQEGGAL